MTDQMPRIGGVLENRLADAKRRDCKAKQFIFRERETGDQAFIIMDGKVEIQKQQNKAWSPLPCWKKAPCLVKWL